MRQASDRCAVEPYLNCQNCYSDMKLVADLTNGQMADVVIDATGNNKSMARALDFASFAGRVVYVGITQQNLEFPHAPVMHRRELTLYASRNAPSGDFPRIIGLIEKGESTLAHGSPTTPRSKKYPQLSPPG